MTDFCYQENSIITLGQEPMHNLFSSSGAISWFIYVTDIRTVLSLLAYTLQIAGIQSIPYQAAY